MIEKSNNVTKGLVKYRSCAWMYETIVNIDSLNKIMEEHWDDIPSDIYMEVDRALTDLRLKIYEYLGQSK